MSDPWINRLEISGPPGEVDAARRAMLPTGSSRTRSGRLCVSFRALYRYLGGQCVICADEVRDPFDISVERGTPPCRGMVRDVYRFQQWGFEPDGLLMALSARHPRLSIVLGWVAPWNGEAASRLFYGGDQRYFRLSARRLDAIYSDIDEEVDDDDEICEKLVEADWAALDEVMTRWRVPVRRIHERDAPRRQVLPRTWDLQLDAITTGIDSTEHAHHSSNEGFGWAIIADSKELARLLRRLGRSEITLETYARPDGSYVQCVGSKEGYAVEVREREARKTPRQWSLGIGSPTGRRVTLSGLNFRRTVDSSRIIDVGDVRGIVRQFLRTKTVPNGFSKTDITTHAKRRVVR